MLVRLLMFGALGDLATREAPAFELADGARAGDVVAAVARRWPAAADTARRVAFAVNQRYVKADHALVGGDEVALIPPVSGG